MRAPLSARAEAGALAAIVAIAAAVRIATAAFPLWFDELASLMFAGQPLSRLWSGWMVRENSPPLYYSLLHGWIALVGTGDVAVRLLSIVIGLMGFVAAWALARRLGGARAGLIAAALLALSASHIAFSQEVRGYGLAHAATLAALTGAVDFLDRKSQRGLVLYAAATLVALYCHTTMILFAALSGGIVLWLVRRSPRAVADWLLANALILAGWAWWGVISWRQITAPSGNIGWIPVPSLTNALVMTATAYLPPYDLELWPTAALLLALLAGIIVAVVRRDPRPGVILLATLALGAPLALFAISQGTPVFLDRTVYWANGPVTVLVALAIDQLRPGRARRIALPAAISAEALLLVVWLAVRQPERWPQALQAIASVDPHAAVVVEGDAMALAAAHYRPLTPGLDIVALDPRPGQPDRWAQGLYHGAHVDAAGAAAMLARRGRIFSLVRSGHDPAWALQPAGQARAWPAASRDYKPYVWVWRAR
jgi:mannosyltransferase